MALNPHNQVYRLVPNPRLKHRWAYPDAVLKAREEALKAQEEASRYNQGPVPEREYPVNQYGVVTVTKVTEKTVSFRDQEGKGYRVSHERWGQLQSRHCTECGNNKEPQDR